MKKRTKLVMYVATILICILILLFQKEEIVKGVAGIVGGSLILYSTGNLALKGWEGIKKDLKDLWNN